MLRRARFWYLSPAIISKSRMAFPVRLSRAHNFLFQQRVYKSPG